MPEPLDKITLEIIGNRLDAICRIMEYRLFHSGYSTILRESHDGSAAICDCNGEVVAGSGSPLHISVYTRSVKALLAARDKRDLRASDSFVITDPYFGGNMHVPDLVIIRPVYLEGGRLCFAVSIAHKPDLGGLVPGSSGAGAREIFHDGLLLPGIRIAAGQRVLPDIEALVRANSRSPDAVMGDVRAQIGCCAIGAVELQRLACEYGAATVASAFEALQSVTEEWITDSLSKWNDGEEEADAFLDDDGVDLGDPVRLFVRAEKSGRKLNFDFQGSSGQVKGPINLRPQAVETAVALAVVTMIDPGIRLNGGVFRAFSLTNPEGSVLNATWPAAVNSYFGITHVLYSTVLRVLAKFNPGRSVGSAGFGQGAIAIGYQGSGSRRPAVQYELLASSLGGTPDHDGANFVLGMHHHTPNTSAEILESEFPVRVHRQEWLTDSCGAGEFRGGPGYLKEYEALDNGHLTLRLGHNFQRGGWGVMGGASGGSTGASLIRDGKEYELKPLETVQLAAGDRLQIRMAGGGGWGDPLRRARQRVVEDVLDGFVSANAALEVYGLSETDIEECGPWLRQATPPGVGIR